MGFFLDVIVEFLLELFMEGASEAVTSRKVSPFVRFLLLSIIFMIYGGLIYTAVYIAIENRSFIAWICAALILLIGILAVTKKYQEYRKKNSDK